jgi:hypothetical protein
MRGGWVKSLLLCSLLIGRAAVAVEDHSNATGNFLSCPDVTMYTSDVETMDGVSIMDGIVRLKKTFAPEDNPWNGTGAFAYRYEGVGKVAGKPVLLFSFGNDGPEESMIERYFAVDRIGSTYELDSLEGGCHWRWEDTQANWYGEFTASERKLIVHNHRLGPYGMYLICTFAGDGIDEAGLTMPTQGRYASWGGLVFRLALDDSAVIVTIDEDANESAWEDAAKKLVGCYVRQ